MYVGIGQFCCSFVSILQKLPSDSTSQINGLSTLPAQLQNAPIGVWRLKITQGY